MFPTIVQNIKPWVSWYTLGFCFAARKQGLVISILVEIK
jgi:hypothetical protein